MAKKKLTSYMTAAEQIAGTVFFVVYLVVLPFVTDPAFRLAERLLGTSISATLQNVIYYYLLFATTIIIFHKYIGHTSKRFADNLGVAAKTLVVGLIALYGLNELVYRLSNLLFTNRTNLNDSTISAQIQDLPQATFLILVVLAPFVEEVLFRGLVFGNLKAKSRTLAYFASAALFAAFHVWQFAAVHQDVAHLLLCLQYMVPGAMLAWAYERSGTLWSAVGVHAAANALAALYLI